MICVVVPDDGLRCGPGRCSVFGCSGHAPHRGTRTTCDRVLSDLPLWLRWLRPSARGRRPTEAGAVRGDANSQCVVRQGHRLRRVSRRRRRAGAWAGLTAGAEGQYFGRADGRCGGPVPWPGRRAMRRASPLAGPTGDAEGRRPRLVPAVACGNSRNIEICR
jgi:hypothetical protein